MALLKKESQEYDEETQSSKGSSSKESLQEHITKKNLSKYAQNGKSCKCNI